MTWPDARAACRPQADDTAAGVVSSGGWIRPWEGDPVGAACYDAVVPRASGTPTMSETARGSALMSTVPQLRQAVAATSTRPRRVMNCLIFDGLNSTASP